MVRFEETLDRVLQGNRETTPCPLPAGHIAISQDYAYGKGKQYASLPLTDLPAFQRGLRAERRCLYAIQALVCPTHIYFDLEMQGGTWAKGFEVVDRLVTAIRSVVGDDVRVLLLSGGDVTQDPFKGKPSFHLHIRGPLPYRNAGHVGKVACSARALLSEEDKPWVDMGVYDKNRCFRLCGSHKTGKEGGAFRQVPMDRLRQALPNNANVLAELNEDEAVLWSASVVPAGSPCVGSDLRPDPVVLRNGRIDFTARAAEYDDWSGPWGTAPAKKSKRRAPAGGTALGPVQDGELVFKTQRAGNTRVHETLQTFAAHADSAIQRGDPLQYDERDVPARGFVMRVDVDVAGDYNAEARERMVRQMCDRFTSFLLEVTCPTWKGKYEFGFVDRSRDGKVSLHIALHGPRLATEEELQFVATRIMKPHLQQNDAVYHDPERVRTHDEIAWGPIIALDQYTDFSIYRKSDTGLSAPYSRTAGRAWGKVCHPDTKNAGRMIWYRTAGDAMEHGVLACSMLGYCAPWEAVVPTASRLLDEISVPMDVDEAANANPSVPPEYVDRCIELLDARTRGKNDPWVRVMAAIVGCNGTDEQLKRWTQRCVEHGHPGRQGDHAGTVRRLRSQGARCRYNALWTDAKADAEKASTTDRLPPPPHELPDATPNRGVTARECVDGLLDLRAECAARGIEYSTVPCNPFVDWVPPVPGQCTMKRSGLGTGKTTGAKETIYAHAALNYLASKAAPGEPARVLVLSPRRTQAVQLFHTVNEATGMRPNAATKAWVCDRGSATYPVPGPLGVTATTLLEHTAFSTLVDKEPWVLYLDTTQKAIEEARLLVCQVESLPRIANGRMLRENGPLLVIMDEIEGLLDQLTGATAEARFDGIVSVWHQIVTNPNATILAMDGFLTTRTVRHFSMVRPRGSSIQVLDAEPPPPPAIPRTAVYYEKAADFKAAMAKDTGRWYFACTSRDFARDVRDSVLGDGAVTVDKALPGNYRTAAGRLVNYREGGMKVVADALKPEALWVAAVVIVTFVVTSGLDWSPPEPTFDRWYSFGTFRVPAVRDAVQQIMRVRKTTTGELRYHLTAHQEEGGRKRKAPPTLANIERKCKADAARRVRWLLHASSGRPVEQLAWLTALVADTAREKAVAIAYYREYYETLLRRSGFTLRGCVHGNTTPTPMKTPDALVLDRFSYLVESGGVPSSVDRSPPGLQKTWESFQVALDAVNRLATRTHRVDRRRLWYWLACEKECDPEAVGSVAMPVPRPAAHFPRPKPVPTRTPSPQRRGPPMPPAVFEFGGVRRMTVFVATDRAPPPGVPLPGAILGAERARLLAAWLASCDLVSEFRATTQHPAEHPAFRRVQGQADVLTALDRLSIPRRLPPLRSVDATAWPAVVSSMDRHSTGFHMQTTSAERPAKTVRALLEKAGMQLFADKRGNSEHRRYIYDVNLPGVTTEGVGDPRPKPKPKPKAAPAPKPKPKPKPRAAPAPKRQRTS